MLNFYKLEIFTAVIETGSFSKAAERLLLTQSAISQHISDLENSLGTRLFDRGPRGVKLTESGEKLRDYTVQILRLVAEAQNAVTNINNLKDGQVSIGATPGVNVYLLPEWLKTFSSRYPNLTVAAQTGTTDEVIASLLNRQLDIGIVEGEIEVEDHPAERLGVLVLRESDLYVIVGRDHPFCKLDSIPAEALNDQPFIARQSRSQTRIWSDMMLAQMNIQPRIVAEFDNQETMKQAVSSGMGITIMPDYAVKNEVQMKLLRALPVDGFSLKRHVKLTWNKDHLFTPTTVAFLRHLARSFPQISALIG